jgi:quercetin dioxygenase-like cupin family protein
MAELEPKPVVKHSDEIEYESIDAAEGMKKGVLLDESDGAPHFALRRFVLDAGASVPRHTNQVEHEQYVLSGEYVVGIERAPETPDGDGEAVGEEYTVSAGDSLLIPAGAVHWYRNETDEEGAFLCAVPNGDDEIQLEE